MGRVSMPQGKGSQLHNRREYEKIGKPIPNNIDSSKTAENIILVDKDIRQAYQEIFGAALEKYNAKQKRTDRKIEDYYDHIQKSKNGEKLFYEDVVQWGSKEDFQKPETRERAKEALVQYVKSFEERNPNLRLIGAYIHMDEASPHLHLDYIPVARGYTRGLEIRNSLDKAMKQMGYHPEKENRKNNATMLWKKNERSVFGEICRNMGLEVEAERKARGSLSVEEYRDAKDSMIGKLEQEKKQLEQKKKQLEKDVEELELKEEQLQVKILSAEDVRNKSFKKCFGGGIKLVRKSGEVASTSETMDYIQSLNKTAARVKTSDKERDEAVKRAEKAEEERDEAKSRAIDEKYNRLALFYRAQDAENENKKLKSYMEELKFFDGSSALDAYKEKMKMGNQKNKNRGRSRGHDDR